jgi:hypothetical protein
MMRDPTTLSRYQRRGRIGLEGHSVAAVAAAVEVAAIGRLDVGANAQRQVSVGSL